MSYMALYRKWRPTDFNEVKGQDAIVRTLRNQIIYNRIGHAYLFCGTRGTGKTSIAKLFAKAVNCENPVDGNPCNECASCRAINSQSSLDVIEIDAASNNGVENVREIREQVQYSPVNGKYKVYIIDEVHMLSIGAFNALLKTLEEPPSYVIFILATTEKHKLPITILSRCQKYDFKRISSQTIAAHLSDLMVKEGVDVEPMAIDYIARAADGSMRDSLSLLDQCISFYLGQTLTYENVLEVLGAVDTTVFSSLLRNILSQNVPEVLHIIDEMIREGRELSQFLTDFLWYLRNLLILKDQDASEDTMDMSAENLKALKEETQMVTNDALLRYIRVLSELSNQLRASTQKRVLLEVGFIKLCKPEMEATTDSLMVRIHQLEEKISRGIPVISQAPPQAAKPVPAQNPVKTPEQLEDELKQKFTPAEAKDLIALKKSWGDILAKADTLLNRYLKPAKVAISDNSNTIQLIYPFEEQLFFKGMNTKDHLDALSSLVTEETGKIVSFECLLEQDAGSRTNESGRITLVEAIQKKVNMKIDFE